MVGVAQLVEHLVVVQDVAGSSPVVHPKFFIVIQTRIMPSARFGFPLVAIFDPNHAYGAI